MKRILGLLLLATCLLATPPSPAVADTPGCVSMSEYANTARFLSVPQIANRYDTNGTYRGQDSDEFSRGYDACWTSDRVVVWYSLITGLSTRWDVR